MDKILLLENLDIGKNFKAMLEKKIETLSVTWVKSGNEAKEIIKDDVYKVVIFDQRLDNGELGINVMRELQKIDSSLIGVMISAYSMPNDTIKAIEEKVLCDYVNKEKISELIPAVVKALQLYQQNKLLLDASKKEYLGKINRKNHIFRPYKFYLLDKSIVNDSYIFEDQWKELYIVNAGEEQCAKKLMEITNTIRVENEIKNEINTNIQIDKIKSLVGGSFSSQETLSTKATQEQFEKEVEEIERTYKMPPIPQDVLQNYLTTTIFEGNQIFKEYRIIVMRECTLCKECAYYCFKAYVPTNRRKLRKINTYKDGTQEIVEVSYRK